MKFNLFTQVKPAKPGTPAKKRIVMLGSPAKEPQAVKQARKASMKAFSTKTRIGVFIASAN